jgi:hypothetical protein
MRVVSRALPAVVALVFASAVLLAARPAAADEGWVIERFEIRLDIGRDGSIAAAEALDVNFRELERHGIFRDLRYLVEYDADRNREYSIDLVGVTAADGRRHQVETLTEGAMRRFRIGDPDRTISGRETYRIAYRLDGALNGFADHDELYWNATGTWPVSIASARIVVSAPGDAIERVDCFQGPAGSSERCDATFTGAEAVFTATRALAEGEQMTIVTGLRKGAVAEPRPRLVARPRDITRLFDRSPGLVAGAAAGLLAALGGIAALWWQVGRDRRYLSAEGLAPGPGRREEQVALLRSDPVAVEFEPPDGMRPAQMGLLFDERADTLDVTATIVDLAVRGYLTITELPATGWFDRTDWQLDRQEPMDAGLLEYERIVLRGLFEGRDSRKVSELKNKFYDDLALAKKELYRDAVARGWFPRNPNSVRTVTRLAGLGVAALGVVATLLLGRRFGAGLLGLPIVAAGMGLAVFARAMPRRTAAGRHAMHRALGFAKYIRTGEVRQQAFAERAGIFTEYLPYAVAFKCVDRWATAFRDIDVQQATASFYSGGTTFDAGDFSSSLGRFSSSMSQTLASTPGGSGGSGFSGGSSGGGGGGGGGGSW